MPESKEKKLTVDSSLTDFKAAYDAKRKLIEREREDFKFALGDQWSIDDVRKLEQAGVKPITDNRIAPNIFLVTGLERQNRTEFKAFPEGEEDGLKAEVATALFRNSIKVSGFKYKSSDQFKDGIICGEAHLELWLDYSDSITQGKPQWRLFHGETLFPEPGFTEYDLSDARYVYKLIRDVSEGDLISLFPDHEKEIKAVGEAGGRLDANWLMGSDTKHIQRRDYPKSDESGKTTDDAKTKGFDLIERYYKKWVKTYYVGDKVKGDLTAAKSKEEANQFIADYQNQIAQDKQAFDQAVEQKMAQHMQMMPPEAQALPPEQHLQMMAQSGELPPPPPEQDPERYIVIERMVPEIWRFAHCGGIEKPLADKKAWFYPEWKGYPFVTFFGRFSTAPLKGDDRHLLIQGLVHGVKGVQEKHNKAEMLVLRHLNSTANSGWEIEEGQMEEEEERKLADFGAMPGVILKRRKGTAPLIRINPSPMSPGHLEIASTSAEAVKAQLGINADLLATQQGGSDSGRAIALRQRQGLLMIQELYDNLSRSRMMAGRFLLSQLNKIYDLESAKKVLGDAFLQKNFPPPMMTEINPQTGLPEQKPMIDPQTQQPMRFDAQMADATITAVLTGDLDKYDVAVGEAAASESQRMAMAAEIHDIAKTYPGMIPPEILVENSQLPTDVKNRIVKAIQFAQQQQQAALEAAKNPKKGNPSASETTIEQAIGG